jgi:hypothetical protein
LTIPPGGPEATQRALAAAADARSVILVEGLSDQIAVETLAGRHGRDLAAEHVAIVPIGGAHAVGRFAASFAGQRLVGLCDENEAPLFRRALSEFFVCVPDLEAELIAALGSAAVLQVLEANRDLNAFRTFQKQPAWRSEPVEAQLRRFMGSADRRKLRYARLLVEAVEPARVPRALAAVLDAVA